MSNKKYFLSAYCSIDPISRVLEAGLHHDQNVGLWKYEQGEVTLLHHWELERLTGEKHYSTSFASKESFLEFIGTLIEPYQIGIDDIDEIIGMPEFEKEMPHQIPSISYHAVCHLFSSMMIDTEIFYAEKLLAFAYDGMPDPIYLLKYNDNFYAGAYSDRGTVKLFPIPSPGILGADASVVFGVPEGTLMALAYATSSCSYEQFDLPKYNRADSNTSLAAIKQICDVIFAYTEKDKGVKFNHFDPRFTERENKISMVMKIIQQVSMAIVDQSIEYGQFKNLD